MQNKGIPPLAERMRPTELNQFLGQDHLTSKDAVIDVMLRSGNLPSIILWGPPGTGKTTLAKLIATNLDRPYFELSAISSGVKDVREVISTAKRQGNAILFIDEIHRFSKSQQDSLLGAVEQGIISLIGATTENPSFEVISALLSRCQVYTLNALSEEDLISLLDTAMQNDESLKKKNIEVSEYEALLQFSGGDARRLLNLFELVVNAQAGESITLTNKGVKEIAQSKMLRYDKSGEQHYDIISAFIKAIRGSDPNAAVYWLARMVEGGEDPKFIARRLLILASEDIGNANPTALVIAKNCFDAVNMIGYPECRITLAQCVIYLASSPKSNAAYEAIKKATQLVKKTGDLQVPLHLRNAPTKMMNDLGYGKDYKYAHAHENNFVDVEFMPAELIGTKLFEAGDNPREKEMDQRVKNLWGDKY